MGGAGFPGFQILEEPGDGQGAEKGKSGNTQGKSGKGKGKGKGGGKKKEKKEKKENAGVGSEVRWSARLILILFVLNSHIQLYIGKNDD